MYVKTRLAKRFLQVCCSVFVCDCVDAPAGVGKRKQKIRLVEGRGGVNGTL